MTERAGLDGDAVCVGLLSLVAVPQLLAELTNLPEDSLSNLRDPINSVHGRILSLFLGTHGSDNGRSAYIYE